MSKTKQKPDTTPESEDQKPKTFREKILSELEDFPANDQLQALTEKLEVNTGHITKHKGELADLEQSYDSEKSKQAREIDSLRDKLFDKSASQMLDELQKIALPNQKRHLLDNIEKLKTNLLALTMNQKDLLFIKRDIEARVRAEEEAEALKKIASMIEEISNLYLKSEDAFYQFKDYATGIFTEFPDYWKRIDKLGFSEPTVQMLGQVNPGRLSGMSLHNFVTIAGGLKGSPLNTDKRFLRDQGKHIVAGPRGENIQGQLEAEQSGDRAAEAALEEIFTGGESSVPRVSEDMLTNR